MIKRERVIMSSRFLNNAPMAVGPHVLTWFKAPWGWVLFSIEPEGPR